MGNPIFELDSEQEEQSNRDICRPDRSLRRRLDLARNPFRVPPNISMSDRRRGQVIRTDYRGDTFTIRGMPEFDVERNSCTERWVLANLLTFSSEQFV